MPQVQKASWALAARKNSNSDSGSSSSSSRGPRDSASGARNLFEGRAPRPAPESRQSSAQREADENLGWWQKPEEVSGQAYTAKPLLPWQVAKLEQAFATGRRKVQVTVLAAQLELSREEVVAWFKDFALLPDGERNAIILARKQEMEAWASKAASRALADTAVGISTEEKEAASKQGFVPFSERKQAPGEVQKKKLSAEAIRTLDSIFQRSNFPSTDVINGLWELHRISRDVALQWFTLRREADGVSSSTEKRRAPREERADSWSRGLDQDGPEPSGRRRGSAAEEESGGEELGEDILQQLASHQPSPSTGRREERPAPRQSRQEPEREREQLQWQERTGQRSSPQQRDEQGERDVPQQPPRDERPRAERRRDPRPEPPAAAPQRDSSRDREQPAPTRGGGGSERSSGGPIIRDWVDTERGGGRDDAPQSSGSGMGSWGELTPTSASTPALRAQRPKVEVVTMSRGELAALRSSLPSPKKHQGVKLAAQLGIKTGTGRDAATIIGDQHYVVASPTLGDEGDETAAGKWNNMWRGRKQEGGTVRRSASGGRTRARRIRAE